MVRRGSKSPASLVKMAEKRKKPPLFGRFYAFCLKAERGTETGFCLFLLFLFRHSKKKQL